MKILKFIMGDWNPLCRPYQKVPADITVDMDMPSSKGLCAKYQVSLAPTFVAVADNNRRISKLVLPQSIEEYEEWLENLKQKHSK